MKTVGIFGGTGYMGGEALRILLEHPAFEVAWVTSRSESSISSVHRNLLGADVPVVRPDAITPCDAYIIALPSGEAATVAAKLLPEGGVVVDLGADFRLKERPAWERVYGKPHPAWNLMEGAVYGIPELHREQITTTRLVANPGCFASAAILGLAPLARAGELLNSTVQVTGISGTSGAGAEPGVPTHHPEIANNVILYNVVDHRHTYEMEQELGELASADVMVHFTPSYIPITRGIVAICSVTPFETTAIDRVKEIYRTFYRDEYFVRLVEEPREAGVSWQWRPYPTVASVSGTNFCHIGLDYDPRRNRLVIFSVLDNLGKGGAHAAVQNLNLMFGLEERTGLSRYGYHPY
jgi:N-acetyl-gamma-glutamyl-phosphate reductase common form